MNACWLMSGISWIFMEVRTRLVFSNRSLPMLVAYWFICFVLIWNENRAHEVDDRVKYVILVPLLSLLSHGPNSAAASPCVKGWAVLKQPVTSEWLCESFESLWIRRLYISGLLLWTKPPSAISQTVVASGDALLAGKNAAEIHSR